ncbi:unnamed protein product [Urochloa humidicola]
MGQVHPVPRAGDPPAPSLPEPLIQEILVRIATPRDLVRASAACACFRRLVADDSFLRRYRTLHPSKLLLGILSPAAVRLFVPAEAPHPNVLAANAFARIADFSRDYLPPGRRSDWITCDARDGRILFKFSNYADPAVLPELVVADPLTRGCTLLPPIPESLVASVLHLVCQHVENFDAFFIPSGDYEDAHFRVIGWTFHQALAVVFVYSSLSGTWTVGTRAFWSDLGLNVYMDDDHMPPEWLPTYAYGCFYWKVPRSNKLLKLDVNRMEFSAVGLPPNHEGRSVAVAEAGEGRFVIVSLIHNNTDAPDSLRYSIRQNEGEIANEHPIETAIPLPSFYNMYDVVAAAEGYIFLLCSRIISQRVTGGRSFGGAAFFALEIKTLKVGRICSPDGGLCSRVFPYFGFPPFMSPRRI